MQQESCNHTGGRTPLSGRDLTGCLHPRRKGSRAIKEGGNLVTVQLAVEAETHLPAVLPSDNRRTSERSAVQDYRGAARKPDLAIQPRTPDRKIEDLDVVTLSVRLQEGR